MKNQTFGNIFAVLGLGGCLYGGLMNRQGMIAESMIIFGISIFCLLFSFAFILKPEKPIEDLWEKDEYDHAVTKFNTSKRSERKAQARRKKFRVVK